LPVDYHIHTRMCGHAVGEMEEYVEQAIAKGLREIGFADHAPMYFFPVEKRDLSIAMREEELADYVAGVREVQKKYRPFPIKLGIEADYTAGMEDKLAAILNKYDFDYVLGSVHFLNGWGFDNSRYIDEYAKWEMNELYEVYFSTLSQAAESGLFDILAHPDLIKKFGFKPDMDLVPLYEKTVKKIAKSGTCIEINTAGLRVPAGEIYPSLKFLEICRSYGVPVSLGSDAHKPEQVGYNFGDAVDMLKAAGYSEVVTFTTKNKKFFGI